MILLTGGAGYIGSHTAVELMENGFDVLIADDLSNSSEDVIERIAEITGSAPLFIRADVSSKDDVERIFTGYDIDAVIHFAGFKAVGESVRNPVKYYKNNLGCTVALLDAMERHNVRRIIFSSSATVYGTLNKPPYNEDMPVGPCSNPYGWTKLMSEQIIRDAVAARPDMCAVLLRYFNPIGAHKSGLIGERPNGIPNNLMPYITQVAVGKLHHLNIFGDDYDTHDGTGVRDYIHVCDLAKGHVAALRWCLNNVGTEAVNLGTGTGHSVLDIVKTFSRVNGLDIPYVIAPRREGDIDVSLADPSKAEKLFGWRAENGLEDMCRDSWHWENRNR